MKKENNSVSGVDSNKSFYSFLPWSMIYKQEKGNDNDVITHLEVTKN